MLVPARTFWEKAILIHVACNRSDPKLDADRQSRHWHDLAVLADHAIGKTAISDRQLLEDVVRRKNIFFRASYTNYEACLSGGLRLLPAAPLLEALRIDYEKMIRDRMFDGVPPTFANSMAFGAKRTAGRRTSGFGARNTQRAKRHLCSKCQRSKFRPGPS